MTTADPKKSVSRYNVAEQILSDNRSHSLLKVRLRRGQPSTNMISYTDPMQKSPFQLANHQANNKINILGKTE